MDNSYLLLIIGSGDVIGQLKENVINFQLQDKIKFIDKIPATELRHYTSNAKLGVTIDKDTNLNYHYSLPNKYKTRTQSHHRLQLYWVVMADLNQQKKWEQQIIQMTSLKKY